MLLLARVPSSKSFRARLHLCSIYPQQPIFPEWIYIDTSSLHFINEMINDWRDILEQTETKQSLWSKDASHPVSGHLSIATRCLDIIYVGASLANFRTTWKTTWVLKFVGVKLSPSAFILVLLWHYCLTTFFFYEHTVLNHLHWITKQLILNYDWGQWKQIWSLCVTLFVVF